MIEKIIDLSVKNKLLTTLITLLIFLASLWAIKSVRLDALPDLSPAQYEILEGLKAGEEVANNALFVLDADAQNNGDY
ncbi:hypothetical protein Kyoto98A_11520 [Helicobacter pylori]